MSGTYYVTDKYYGNTKPVEGEPPVFGIRTIGSAKWIDQSSPDPIKAIQGEIWAGAGHIEITAPGTGRGGKGNSTFEEIDTEQRQAIRELVKINEVNLSVHSTPNVQMTGQSRNGFSDEQRQKSIEEVKKAIDFARDVSSGGSIVVHTGEFPRGLDIPDRYKGQFRFYEEEPKDAQYLLVDNDTGNFIQSVRANEEIAQPVYKRTKDGKDYLYLTDETGKPVYNDTLKGFILERKGLSDKDWDKLSENEKAQAKVRLVETDEHGNLQTKMLKFQDFMNQERKEGKSMNDIVRKFYEEQTYGSVMQALGQSRVYEDKYVEGLKQREHIKKELNFYKRLKDSVDTDKWDRIKSDFTAKNPRMRGDPDETLDPVKALTEALDNNQREILYGQETSLSGRKQAKELLKRIEHVRDVESYALEKSKKSFATLGIYAMDQWEAAKAKRAADDPIQKKPLFISLENIYPEFGYGSHPEELITVVKNARQEMAKQLWDQRRVKSMAEAEKAAERHIKVTFDTGHMHMWRKHFVPTGDAEQTEKDYKKWYLGQVEKLAAGGYIGNVHLADNFGYDDAHLAPGAGNAPIKEVLDILKKHGYNEKMAVEGGFNQGKNGYHETWKMVGAHVDKSGGQYMRGRAGTDAWLNPNANFRYIRDGYLGVANRPNFIFRGYSPDNDDWKPWSGLGME